MTSKFQDMWDKLWPGDAPPPSRGELVGIYNKGREEGDFKQFEEVVDEALRAYLEETETVVSSTGDYTKTSLSFEPAPPWAIDFLSAMVLQYLAHKRMDQIWVDDLQQWRHEVGKDGEKDE